jgi:chloramphenicol O-acetyltransferase type A
VGVKVYPALVYMVARAVNAHPEFRMDVVEGKLGYYDSINPSYTVLHADSETFSSVWTEYDADFRVFYERYLSDIACYGDIRALDAKPGGGNNLVNISSLPWLSFTGFNLNLKSDYDYLLPIFTFGKFVEEGEKTILPLAIQAHHAVADGFHTARLMNDMQVWADHFAMGD